VKVLGVEWNVSKQGLLKPVINIEPTELGGVTVSNVTGYNARYIVDNEIAEGSVIEIIRSGDVIPKHIQTLECPLDVIERYLDMNCPSCGSELRHGDVDLICTNSSCKEMKIQKLVHFFNTLGIEDFGEPSIRKFYEKGYQDPVDIVRFMTSESIQWIDGFAEKSAENLIRQFKKVCTEGISLPKLLHALDYFEGKLGEKRAQAIIGSLYYEEVLALKVEDIIVNGVGPAIAEAFLTAIDKWQRDGLRGLELVKVQGTQEIEIKGSLYEGWNICFTGCRPTKEMEQRIAENGGKIVDSVTKTTTHLCVKDDLSMTSSKAIKAKTLGVKIILFKNLNIESTK